MGQSTVNGNQADLLTPITYTSTHLPETVTDAAGQTTAYEYNSFGQIKKITNAKSEETTFTYDRDQDNNSETDGYLVEITGSVAGATTTFEYDTFGRPWKVTNPDGYIITTEYEAIEEVSTKTLNRPSKII